MKRIHYAMLATIIMTVLIAGNAHSGSGIFGGSMRPAEYDDASTAPRSNWELSANDPMVLDKADRPYVESIDPLEPVSAEIDLEVTVVGWGDQLNKPWEIILKNIGNQSPPPPNGMFDVSNVAIVQFKYHVRGAVIDNKEYQPNCFIARLFMIVPAAGQETRIQLPVQQLYPPYLDWPWWVEGWECTVGCVLAAANYEFEDWQFIEPNYDNNIAQC